MAKKNKVVEATEQVPATRRMRAPPSAAPVAAPVAALPDVAALTAQYLASYDLKALAVKQCEEAGQALKDALTGQGAKGSKAGDRVIELRRVHGTPARIDAAGAKLAYESLWALHDDQQRRLASLNQVVAPPLLSRNLPMTAPLDAPGRFYLQVRSAAGRREEHDDG